VKYYDEYDDDFNVQRYDVHDCPFCGSKNTDLYQTQVKCERCDAHGPDVGVEQWPLAITLWNELPRKQGEELKQLRAHWSNLSRRVKRAEKKARQARAEVEKLEAANKSRVERANKAWVQEREAWLARPVNEDVDG
jgi:hypothetical protein